MRALFAGEPVRASDRDPEGRAVLRPGEPAEVHVRRPGLHQAGPPGQVSTPYTHSLLDPKIFITDLDA